MAPPSRSSASRQSRGDTGKLVLGLLILLGLIASVFLIFSNNLQLVRIGLVAALWAAVIGAIAATRYRRESADDRAKARDLQKVYQLQLEREISARREFEHDVESRVREEVGAESEELAALRAELVVLRENLQRLFDGVQPAHRPALHADAFRIQELTSASSANDNHTETDWDPWNAPPMSPISMTPIFEPDHPEPPAFASPFDDPVTAETSIVPPEQIAPEAPADPHPSDISFAAFLDSHASETFASFDAYRSATFDPFDPLEGLGPSRPVVEPLRRPEPREERDFRKESRWGDTAENGATWAGDLSRDDTGPARNTARPHDDPTVNPARNAAWEPGDANPLGDTAGSPAWSGDSARDGRRPENIGEAWDATVTEPARPIEAPRGGAIWDRGATREPSVAPDAEPARDEPAPAAPPMPREPSAEPAATAWHDLRDESSPTRSPAPSNQAAPGTPIGTPGARRRRRGAEDSTHRLSVAEIMANLRSEQDDDTKR